MPLYKNKFGILSLTDKGLRNAGHLLFVTINPEN